MTVLVGQRRPRLQTRPRYSAPNPVIPEVPPAPQLRHSVRSRGIHLPRANASAREASAPLHSTMDTATSRSMTALVFRAQSRNPSPARQRINQKIQRPLHSRSIHGGVHRALASLADALARGRWIPQLPSEYQRRHTARSTMDTATSRSMTALVFRGQSRNPSPASQRISQIIQRPLHSTMDTATSRSMTALVFRGQLRNPSPASQRISQRSQRPVHSTMDTATSRSMTALVFRGQLRNPVPLAPQLRHSAHSRTFLG